MTGRTALLVGANGRIGEAIAAELGSAGLRVVAASRDLERLDDLCRRLGAQGVECEAVGLDVCDDGAVAGAVERAASDGLDVAVNNVGVAHRPTPMPDLDLEDLDRVLATTLRGVAVAMKHQLAAMVEGGALVNVTSSAGLRAAPGMAAYAAAKHGVVGLTRTAALDCARSGIRVNAVAPGPIASGGTERQPEEIRRRIGEGMPMGRIGTSAEVARAVGWLASPMSSFTTGVVLSVDGGKLA